MFFGRKKKEEEKKEEPFLPATEGFGFDEIKEAIERKEQRPEVGLPSLRPELPSLPKTEVKAPELPLFKPEELKPVMETRPPIQETKPEIKEVKPEVKEKPEIYVKIDKYKEVLSTLEAMTFKIKEIESLLTELESIKEKEVEKLNEWKKLLEEYKEKINFVLNTLKGE